MAYRFNPFTSQLDFYQEDTQFVSSGGIANLTSGQQDQIREGSIVTTTDGRRWAYSGTGSKTLEASYVELADITPEWSVIAGKPSIPTAAPAAGQIMAGNAGGTAFATVSVSGDATLAATGALTIANNAVTNAKLAAAATATLKGRTAPGAGDVSDLTASDVRALLNVADGAEANVQANWTESNAALDSFIQNKPTLGGAALLNVGTTTGTVAAGDDSRLSDARTPTAHTHGNISNTGTIGSTAGLPVVTTTSGALTTLPLGTAGQALVVNSGATALEFAAPAAGVTNVTATAPLTSSGGATPDISTSIATNRIVGRSTAGTGVMEQLTPVGITVSGGNITGIGGTVGTVDNAVPRADGTGGFTVQGSGLIVEDAIESFTSITGDAGTDVITATGSAFANGQPIRFTSLTGGSGLNTTTNYFVREVSGATFKVETSIGGGAINFTTNITAGTLLTGHSVSTNVTLSENTTATNSDLVLTPKGTGALIAGPKPAGTASTGNARGSGAVDLQLSRSAAAQVASGSNSFAAGLENTASGTASVAMGQGCTAGALAAVAVGYFCSAPVNAAVALGNSSAANGFFSVAIGQQNQTSATTAVSIGQQNQSSASLAHSFGYLSLANRYAMQSYAAGVFAAVGDAQHARFVLRCKTTTNAAVEMALDGSTTYFGIPSGKVIACTINISGVKSDGSAVAHYVRQYAVKNVGGTSSEVYAPVTIGTDNAAGTVIALSANNTDDTLRIAVTGIAAETWRWVASVDAVEIQYGT